MEQLEDIKKCDECAADTNENQSKEAKVTIKHSSLFYFTANCKTVKNMKLF